MIQALKIVEDFASYPECHRFESYLSHIRNHGETTLRGFLMSDAQKKKSQKKPLFGGQTGVSFDNTAEYNLG